MSSQLSSKIFEKRLLLICKVIAKQKAYLSIKNPHMPRFCSGVRTTGIRVPSSLLGMFSKSNDSGHQDQAGNNWQPPRWDYLTFLTETWCTLISNWPFPPFPTPKTSLLFEFINLFILDISYQGASLVAQTVKRLSAVQDQIPYVRNHAVFVFLWLAYIT